ncbi:MAG: CoA transferase [Acidimicrobiales bacterium]
MAGPLQGIKVLEIAGIGPGPFAAMLLADLGADVLRIDRADCVSATTPGDGRTSTCSTGDAARSASTSKRQAGVEALLELVELADVLIEGFRPGVTERLGFGPDVCLSGSSTAA